jgi:Ca-activated chloride channel family protein
MRIGIYPSRSEPVILRWHGYKPQGLKNMISLLKLAVILMITTGVGLLYNAVLPVKNTLVSVVVQEANSVQNKPLIPKSFSSQEPVSSYQDVESGSLFFVEHTAEDNPTSYIPGPLVDTQVNIDVTGIIARTRVSQTFHNPGKSWVNGIYAFPLPENAAVDHLLLKVGERIIEGQIQPKKIAKKIFEQAKQEGKKASLIEQQRPNLFTNSVANIGPGETVTITIEYQQTIEYKNKQFRLRFPMTISPRYLPATPINVEFSKLGWAQTNSLDPKLNHLSEQNQFKGQSANSGSDTKASKANTELSNNISLKVNLQVGFALNTISSEFHPVKTVEASKNQYQITLQNTAVANKDFVLHWQTQNNNNPAAAHFTEQKNGKEYGLIMLMPPQQDVTNTLQRELIFVLDTSGSMEGESIIQAKEALIMGITQLSQHDRFNIIEFNSHAQKMWLSAKPANDPNKHKAVEFVRGLSADGGTEMAEALNMALAGKNPQGESTFLRQVIFITDGSVTNEESLMQLIQQNLGDSRLFTVGIGSSPNSYFMSEAALSGKGTFTYIGAVSQVHEKMQNLLTKLSSPAMQDMHLSFIQSTVFYPKVIPDLYSDEPMIISYRRVLNSLNDEQQAIKLSGRQADSPWAVSLELTSQSNNSGVAVLWARNKIDQLSRERRKEISSAERDQLEQDITETAMAHHLVSQYTSLVAVDVTPSKPENVSATDSVTKNHLPHGWRGIGTLPQTATSAPLKLLVGSILIGFVICMQFFTRKRRFQAI